MWGANKKKWCDGCNRRTKHDYDYIGKERDGDPFFKEIFSPKGIFLSIATFSLYLWYKVWDEVDGSREIYLYEDQCYECGRKSQSRDSSKRL